MSLHIYQLRAGLGSRIVCTRKKRFLPSEYDYNEPQRKNLVELEKSCKPPHPTSTATLLYNAASALVLEHRLKTI